MALHAIHLCSGYGGFELACRIAGLDVRTVAHVEREAFAAATLVARMDEALLDRAPIWDDLCTFDGRPWRGRVDLITAGFPCQPFSAAGRKLGVDDERWIWPDIARIIADVGPDIVWLENVPQLVRLGLPHVLSDLAALGFDAEWGLLAAGDVGATQHRKRLWILAYRDIDGLRRLWREPADDRDARGDVDGPCSPHVGGADGEGRTIGRHQGPRPSFAGEPDLGGAVGFPPGPDDDDAWRAWIGAGGPEPQVRRGPDGRPVELADALHLGGNGLVPLAAAHAFRVLARRAIDGAAVSGAVAGGAA